MNAATLALDTEPTITEVETEDVAPESEETPIAEPILSDGTATYDPGDDKLRLRVVTRMPRELYLTLKAIGFAWAPKQETIWAMWSPAREDRLIELVGEITDEDSTLVDRAEFRADRFEGYRERRHDDAERAKAAVDRIADNIPLGQPILVGHHSERHARRDAKRIENGMRLAVTMWERENYWEARAKAVLRHADRKERPDVRYRRIKGIETDRRKAEKTIAEAETFLKLWNAPGLTHDRAQAIANHDHVSLPLEPGQQWPESIWGALDKAKITAEDAAGVAIRSHERQIRHARRLIAHLALRLTYENALLAEDGGVVTHHHDIAIGGKVLVKSWRTRHLETWLVVRRVNNGAGEVVQSVSTQAGVVAIEDVKGYEPPTAENVAKVKAAAKLPPLVNYPGEGFVTMTRERWDRHSGEDKKAHRAEATETHGAYRYRMSWVPGGSWKTAQVFLTDEKIVERPLLVVAAPAVKLPAPEVVEASALADLERRAAATARRTEIEADRAASPFAAMKAQLEGGGVAVVVADQLFPTPPALAARVAEAAGVQAHHRVLEPSSGTGNLVAALRNAMKTTCDAENLKITHVEINRELARATGALCADFLSCRPGEIGFETPFDRVVMNPPFSEKADVEHVTHALSFLAPGGRLVAIMSAGVTYRSDRKTSAFRDLVLSLGGTIEDLPAGSFKSSGTNWPTVLVTITKG